MHLQSHVIVSCGETLVQYFGSSSVFGQELRKVQAYGSWVEHNAMWEWLRMGGTIPRQGLLLTVERRIEGPYGRRSWWEMLVEESHTDMEARRYC